MRVLPRTLGFYHFSVVLLVPPGFNKLSWGLGLQVLGENSVSHIGKIKAMFIPGQRSWSPMVRSWTSSSLKSSTPSWSWRWTQTWKPSCGSWTITAAKATEVSVGQKALLIFFLIPQMKYFQKFQVWLLHDLEKSCRKHVICCSEENSAQANSKKPYKKISKSIPGAAVWQPCMRWSWKIWFPQVRLQARESARNWMAAGS